MIMTVKFISQFTFGGYRDWMRGFLICFDYCLLSLLYLTWSSLSWCIRRMWESQRGNDSFKWPLLSIVESSIMSPFSLRGRRIVRNSCSGKEGFDIKYQGD